MNLKKSALLLLLPLFFTCKTENNKIVWTHFDEDLDELHGDIMQVTIKYDHPFAKSFYYVFNIDRDGNEIGVHMHFGEIHLRTRYVTKYDKSSNTVDFIGYMKDISGSKRHQVSGSETIDGIYKYDNQGRIIKFLKIGGVDDGDSSIYKYNNFNDLIERNDYSDGKLHSKTKFKYDNRHLITESLGEFEGDSSSEKISYQYKNFDSRNNWLIKIIKSEDGTNTILTRKITYY